MTNIQSYIEPPLRPEPEKIIHETVVLIGEHASQYEFFFWKLRILE